MKHTAQHTPGPWYVGGRAKHDAKLDCNLPRIWADDHAGIADICTRRQLCSGLSAEEKANASLIAAAPDLLEALKDAYQTLLSRGHHMGLDDGGPVMDKVRAALAKAEGK